jgi:hypothetical protein
MSDIENDIAERKRAIFDLIEHNEMLDDDGYPTDAALDVIRLWHWDNAKGWFKFIEGLWHFHSWGWREDDEAHEYLKDEIVRRYYVSTCGWSGNESIIRAMQENKSMMWTLTWVQSRRGGHYIFELREIHQ